MPFVLLLLLILNLPFTISHLVSMLLGEMGPFCKEHLVWVHKSGRNIPLEYSEFAYIYHRDNYNYLRTFSNEGFLISQSLDRMQQKLPSTEFFRANRQVILHISSCTHSRTLPFGKLGVETNPAFDGEIIVSQKRAKDFRIWAGKP
jgi:DNA-binding LytR/AlgR family response regulator